MSLKSSCSIRREAYHGVVVNSGQLSKPNDITHIMYMIFFIATTIGLIIYVTDGQLIRLSRRVKNISMQRICDRPTSELCHLENVNRMKLVDSVKLSYCSVNVQLSISLIHLLTSLDAFWLAG
ncbi:hypothetical protein T01_16233 [Trichinella spiralis]|uniref:Uncharacterized protein n=1 Tax=Trichinella spiralis TaxID=6334 RepID=A0A0V1B565_TRISP|nr:hypothetical protein T01_12928 [Trichinella spiralis]KRY32146.1 hypothetical protein T01_16233 [Trichinella spiralis]